MSLDLIYKHPLYVSPATSEKFADESVLATYNDVKLTDKQIKGNFSFVLKLTTHRIKLDYTGGFETALEVPLKLIKSSEIKGTGLFTKTYSLHIYLASGWDLTLDYKNVKEINDKLQVALSTKAWLHTKTLSESSLYGGMSQIRDKMASEVKSVKAVVGTSATDINSLIKQSEKLREIIKDLKGSIQKDPNSETSEIDDILSSIGDVSVITKSEAGKKFYDELAQDIWRVSKELLQRYRGMVSLIDVFWYLNEKRKISLVTAKDLLLACERLPVLNLPIRVVEISKGTKVIQSTNFNSDEDYEQNIKPYIDMWFGISAEELSRKSKLPLLVARSKLELALQKGKVCLDDSVEGRRYFFNFFLGF